jgi:hypothetical protein
MARRISRGTPAIPNQYEQERLIRLLQTDAELRSAIETLMGRRLDEMTIGEQITAIMDFDENGRTLAAFNSSARARAEAFSLAAARNGDSYLNDQLNAANATIELLRAEIAELEAQLVAKPARRPGTKAVSHR